MQPAISTPAVPFVHRGLPSFMRAQFWTARHGGHSGYREAGFVFGRHIPNECPSNAELDEWAEEIARLEAFIDDDDALVPWLLRTFPAILSQVPARRRPEFIAGIRMAADEGHLRDY